MVGNYERQWDWRQAFIDVSGIASYLAIGLALWVGILLQLRPHLLSYLGLDTPRSQMLILLICATVTWALWKLAMRLGPVAENAAELLWLPSARQRNWQLALTWLILSLAAAFTVVTAFTLLPAGNRWMQVTTLPLTIMVGIPLLAAAQRYGWESLLDAVLTGVGAALVTAMAVTLLLPTSQVMAAALALLAVLVTIAVQYRRQRVERTRLAMIPRWSLLRAAAFRDAVTGVVQLFDGQAALLYQDLYHRVRRWRLPLPALHLATRTAVRIFTSYSATIISLVIASGFAAHATTASAGFWLALVGAGLLTQHGSAVWTDWITAAALRRMFNTGWGTSLLVLTAVLLTPVLTGVLSLVAAAQAATDAPTSGMLAGAYVLAVLLPVLVLVETSAQTLSTPQAEGFIVTADGMIVPTSMFSRIGSGALTPIVVASIATVWQMSAGLVALAVFGALGTGSLLSRWRRSKARVS